MPSSCLVSTGEEPREEAVAVLAREVSDTGERQSPGGGGKGASALVVGLVEGEGEEERPPLPKVTQKGAALSVETYSSSTAAHCVWLKLSRPDVHGDGKECGQGRVVHVVRCEGEMETERKRGVVRREVDKGRSIHTHTDTQTYTHMTTHREHTPKQHTPHTYTPRRCRDAGERSVSRSGLVRGTLA